LTHPQTCFQHARTNVHGQLLITLVKQSTASMSNNLSTFFGGLLLPIHNKG